MTDSHIHFLDSGSNPSSSHNYVQVATPKSPSSDSAWSDSEDRHSGSNGNSSVISLKNKLADQINVEILLKHREHKLVEREIRKVERTMHTLERLHNDEKYGEFMTHLITLKRKANGILQDQQQQLLQLQDPLAIGSTAGLDKGFTITKSSLRPSTSSSTTGNAVCSSTTTTTTTSSVVRNDHNRTSYGGIPSLLLPNGQKICVHKLSSGKLVKISCPVCSRTDFGSAQGFLNHARLLHQLEFKSQSDVAIKCGVELSDAEKDLWEQQQLQDGDSIDMIQQRKKVKVESNSGPSRVKYLSRVVKDDSDGFEELIKDVTSKDPIEYDDEEAESPGGTATFSNPSSDMKGQHNRRKSRGGLSAVKFNDDPCDALDDPISSSDIGLTAEELKLTPAQRRRVPSIPNPLRTRSRSSRENSR
jgi:ADA HAT complex component 1